MDIDFKLDLRNKNFKIILLIFFYLLVFYFLIFKNILKLAEINEILEQENVKIGKLNYEKNTILEALSIKKANFERDRELIENNEKKFNKKKFDNMSTLFGYIEEKINENNIIFQSFGRSRKDEDKLKVSMTFSAGEENIKNFFRDMENEGYDISFSSSYLKISSQGTLLEVKTTLLAGVLDKTKKDDSITKITDNKDIFEKSYSKNSDEKISHSYMRVGNRKYYRTSRKKEIEDKSKDKEKKIKLKKKAENTEKENIKKGEEE